MNEQEFLDFWNTIKWPEEKVIYFRLYHDDLGRPLFYSHEDTAGKYIDVTPEQFALGDMQVSVVNGILTPRKRPVAPKLVPGDTGTPCYINDAAVVVDQEQPHQRWRLKTYN